MSNPLEYLRGGYPGVNPEILEEHEPLRLARRRLRLQDQLQSWDRSILGYPEGLMRRIDEVVLEIANHVQTQIRVTSTWERITQALILQDIQRSKRQRIDDRY